jgi:hypothetical protein
MKFAISVAVSVLGVVPCLAATASAAEVQPSYEALLSAAATTQKLLKDIEPAVSPYAPKSDREDIILMAAITVSQLSSSQRLLVIEQLLAALPVAQAKYESDFEDFTSVATVVGLGGIVALYVAHELKSPKALSAGFAALVSASLIKIYLVRPDTLRSHVQQLRGDLEQLRDAMILEIKTQNL